MFQKQMVSTRLLLYSHAAIWGVMSFLVEKFTKIPTSSILCAGTKKGFIHSGSYTPLAYYRGPAPLVAPHTRSTLLGSYESGHQKSCAPFLALGAAGCLFSSSDRERTALETVDTGPVVDALSPQPGDSRAWGCFQESRSSSGSSVESGPKEVSIRMRDTELTSFIRIRRSGAALLGGEANFSCKLSITLEAPRSFLSPPPAALGDLSTTWRRVDLKGGFGGASL